MTTKHKPVIQFAGGAAALDDGQLRSRLANAPQWFRQSLDHQREQRGLAPLFAVRAGAASSRSPAPVAPVKLPKAVWTLTCVCAPGISEPLAMRAGEPAMPEHITADAWRSALARVREGRHIDIRCGHGKDAHVLGRSGTPAVRFAVSDAVGLVLELDLRDADVGRRPDCCSIGFRCLRSHVEHHRGMPIRIVDDLVLSHIALGERWSLEPAYKLSRIARSMKWNARGAVIDAVVATMNDMRRVCPYILAR
jgi:hypothetical protein